ncbi:Major Facilitator Superfamily protein [uncultured archaeon]|nr:Major Facilitator Superfamily protein [uncultured archaeon]
MQKKRKALPVKNGQKVKIFGFASLLNDFGANMIYPIWPIFLTTVLGANMSVLGLVDGLGDALVSLSQAGSGYASDRLKKRKVFIWLGYLLGAISRFGYAIATTWPMVIPFRILDRAGKIRDAPRDAIVADESTHKNRGKHFGIIKGMDKLGGVFGIIACVMLFNFLGYTNLFLLAALPSVLSVGLVYFLIKERKDGKIKLYKGIQLHSLTRDYKLFLILSAILALGSFSYSFLLVFANKSGYAAGLLPLLYLVYIAVTAAFSYPFGNLSDMIGRKAVMYISILLWALTCIIFMISSLWWAILIGFAFFGLHQAALAPVQTTFVSELAPKKFRASALGGFQMAIGLCALPASVIAGILWDTINPTAPFALALILTALSAVLLFFVKNKK